MEDFATFCKTEKHNKAIELQNSVKEQTGFIASRLNRDNFWNLVFAFLLFLAWTAGLVLPQTLGGIIFWLTFPCAILLLKHTSYLTLDKDKMEFTSSSGKKIQKSGVCFIFLIVTSFFLSAGIAGVINKWANIESTIAGQLLFAFFFSLLPSLYCILRNFPIAVYFKKETWVTDHNNSSYPSSSRSHKNWLWYSVWNKH
jgi:hypothetical protein